MLKFLLRSHSRQRLGCYFNRFVSTVDQNQNAQFIEVLDTMNNHNIKRRFLAVQAEIEVLLEHERRLATHPVLNDFTVDNWLEILKMNLKSQRYRYVQQLCRGKIKKEVRTNRETATKMTPYFQTVNRDVKTNFYRYNLVHAMSYGQNIIFDMGFEQSMIPDENEILVNEVADVFDANCKLKEPWNIICCNVDEDGDVFFEFCRRLWRKGILTPMMQFTQKDYFTLYPKERLVYLTPDAEEDLVYKHDDVYVIGGLVEYAFHKRPRTLKKAMAGNIRTARIPRKFVDIREILVPFQKVVDRLQDIKSESIERSCDISFLNIDKAIDERELC